jgi:hypothetical protein
MHMLVVHIDVIVGQFQQTIKQLLAMGGVTYSYFTIRSLAIHSMSFFAMFNLAYGVATPGGIFMPSIMVQLNIELNFSGLTS